MKKFAGYSGEQLHKGIGGSDVYINYSTWESVEQFSDDIRRHLAGLPIAARADTFTYRAAKFVRRHRLAVVAVALVLLSLLGGIFATAYAARQARNERDRANQAAAAAEAATKSLASVFEFADPAGDYGKRIAGSGR